MVGMHQDEGMGALGLLEAESSLASCPQPPAGAAINHACPCPPAGLLLGTMLCTLSRYLLTQSSCSRRLYQKPAKLHSLSSNTPSLRQALCTRRPVPNTPVPAPGTQPLLQCLPCWFPGSECPAGAGYMPLAAETGCAAAAKDSSVSD